MKKFYIHNCANGHTMEVSEKLTERIVNNSAWFINQTDDGYDAEAPTGRLFYIQILERRMYTGNDFDWTVNPTWN